MWWKPPTASCWKLSSFCRIQFYIVNSHFCMYLVVCCMSQKTEKPTLSGTRIKTRKRGKKNNTKTLEPSLLMWTLCSIIIDVAFILTFLINAQQMRRRSMILLDSEIQFWQDLLRLGMIWSPSTNTWMLLGPN